MPSRSSILPTPTEHRLPKSTRNRTVRALATHPSSSKFPWRRWSDGEQDVVLRGIAQLKDEGLPTGQFELHDLMRRTATALTLEIRRLHEGAVRYHVDPKGQVNCNAVTARHRGFQGRKAGVSGWGRRFFARVYGECDGILDVQPKLV